MHLVSAVTAVTDVTTVTTVTWVFSPSLWEENERDRPPAGGVSRSQQGKSMCRIKGDFCDINNTGNRHILCAHGAPDG